MKTANESQKPQLQRTTIAMAVPAALFVVLCFVSRLKKGLRPGYDDYAIIIALVRNYLGIYLGTGFLNILSGSRFYLPMQGSI